MKFLVLLTDWSLLAKPITSSLSFLCFIKALRQLWGCLRGQFLIERWSKWKDEEQWSWQVCTQGRSCGDCCRTNMMSRAITVKPPQYDRLILKALFSCCRAAQQRRYFSPRCAGMLFPSVTSCVLQWGRWLVVQRLTQAVWGENKEGHQPHHMQGHQQAESCKMFIVK